MPPVTTRPENGSRLQMRLMYGGISASSVVTVALIHLVASGSEQNVSGCPKLGSCLAMRRHMSQPPPGLRSGFHAAGECWDPIVEFSTQPPLVMNTRSFCVRSMDDLSPSWSMSMRTASFFVFVPYGLRLKKPDVAWIFWIVSCPTPVRSRSGPFPPPIANSTFSTLVL